MESTSVLAFEDVHRTFQTRSGIFHQIIGEVHAVTGISLMIQQGETLGLVGESGCGKSTLGRMAVGLFTPTSGKIFFHGKLFSAGGEKVHESAQGRLQMVFQDPFSSFNPRLRIVSSVGEPLRSVSKQEKREKTLDILARVGLSPEYADRYPHEFSGGQRQRAAIARALITKPDLVVCDEAVSALDASVQAQVLNLLKDVQEDFGLAYLFISHDLGVVGHMSDRVAVMYLGRIVEEASCEALFHEAAHPYTLALLSSAPDIHASASSIKHLLSGEPPSPFSPPQGCAFHPRCPYATPHCRQDIPNLQEISTGHFVACYIASESSHD